MTMKTDEFTQETGIGASLISMGLTIVRILIGSYFLAAATALYFDPVGQTLLGFLMAEEGARAVETIFLFVTALAILMGIVTRPAATLLAGYVVALAVMHNAIGSGSGAFSAFMRDIVLIATVFMVTAAQSRSGPGGTKAPFARHSHALKTHASGALGDKVDTLTVARKRADAFDEDDANIFSDLWERKPASA